MALLPTITATDVAETRPTIALLPVGSWEQHGDHLPLATDAIIAATIAHRLADRYGLLELPPVTIACSHEHVGIPDRPGTVSITAATLISIIEDIRASLAQTGIEHLILINAHGGNYVLQNIVQQANSSGKPQLGLYPDKVEWVAARKDANMTTDNHADMHAGELETSILLSEHPETVRSSYHSSDFEADDRRNLLVIGMAGYTPTGVIGKPSAATADKGALALESLSSNFAPYLDLFQGNPKPS